MAKTSKISVLILAILAGILLYLNSGEDTNPGTFFLFLALLLCGLITFIIILISDILKINKTKSMQSLNPTAIGLIIISCTIYAADRMSQPNKIPILIQAGYSPGVAASSLVLRVDNSYEFFNGAFLSSNTKHGTYMLKDSFIFLDGGKVDKALVSNRLLLNSREKIIYQVDSNGKCIENSIPFFINIDNRSK